MPILIDNPEIEARLNALATARGTDPMEALVRALDELELIHPQDEASSQQEESEDEETLAGLRRGIEDIEAGRHLSLEESRQWARGELEKRIRHYQQRQSSPTAPASPQAVVTSPQAAATRGA